MNNYCSVSQDLHVTAVFKTLQSPDGKNHILYFQILTGLNHKNNPTENPGPT